MLLGTQSIGRHLGGSLVDLMSLQAAEQMGATKIVKVLLQDPPTFFLEQGHAKVAQMVVMEVFATNEVRRPLFTLGIVSSIAVSLAETLGYGCFWLPLLAWATQSGCKEGPQIIFRVFITQFESGLYQ